MTRIENAMEQNKVFRKATLQDLDKIVELNDILVKKDAAEFDPTIDPEWSLRDGPEYFRNKIQSADSFVEVCEVGSEVAGYFCGSLAQPLPYQRKDLVYAEPENSLIISEFRNAKLGSVFMQNFEKWCVERNVDILTSAISSANAQSLAFHSKNGFQPYVTLLQKKLKQ